MGLIIMGIAFLLFVTVINIMTHRCIKDMRRVISDLAKQNVKLCERNSAYYSAIRRLKWLATGESSGVSNCAELVGNEEGIPCDDIEVLRNAIIGLPN